MNSVCNGAYAAINFLSELLFLVQCLPDLGCQFFYGEGLLDEIHPFIEYAVVGDDIGRI